MNDACFRAFSEVQVINVTGNNLGGFDEKTDLRQRSWHLKDYLRRLTWFPKLRRVIINNNNITALNMPFGPRSLDVQLDVRDNPIRYVSVDVVSESKQESHDNSSPDSVE